MANGKMCICSASYKQNFIFGPEKPRPTKPGPKGFATIYVKEFAHTDEFKLTERSEEVVHV